MERCRWKEKRKMSCGKPNKRKPWMGNLALKGVFIEAKRREEGRN